MPNNGIAYGLLAALHQSAELRQSELREEAAEHRRARQVQPRQENRILGLVLPHLRRQR
jgi:hypothetical protein